MRLLVASFVSVLLYSPNALASELALSWQAPVGCPTLRDVRAGLETRLKHPVQIGPDAPLRVAASVTSERDGFRLELITHADGAESRRELFTPSCNELSRATVLLASLLLSTQAAAQPLPPPAATTSSSSPTLTRLHATLSASLDVERLPGFGAGVSGRLGVDLGALRLEAGALYLPTRSDAVEPVPGAHVSLQLLAAEADACYALTRAPRVAPCAYLSLGSLSAQGRGLAQDERTNSLWLSGGLGAQLGVPLSTVWELQAELALGVPLRRAQLATRDQGLVYRVAAVNGQLQLGISAYFP